MIPLKKKVGNLYQSQNTASFQTTISKCSPLTSCIQDFLGKVEADTNPWCPPAVENMCQAAQVIQLKSLALDLREEADTPL